MIVSVFFISLVFACEFVSMLVWETSEIDLYVPKQIESIEGTRKKSKECGMRT